MHRNSRTFQSIRAAVNILAVAGLSSLAATAQAQTYTLTDLGTLGGSQSFATGVNNSGQVVGNSLTSDGATHGFLYNGGGSLKDLGTTINGISVYSGEPYTTTGTDSYAYSINNKGQVAGTITGGESSNYGTAFVSTPNGGKLNQLYIAGADFANVAFGINDKGQIAGSTDNGTFFYDPSVGFDSYAELPNFYGVAINNNGEVVGNISERPEAAVWQPNGGPIPGGGFALGPGFYSPAFDINDSGQVVGSSDDVDKFYSQHAFLSSATAGEPSMDLGTLVKNVNPNNDNTFSEAHGVNNKDQVVGTSEIDENTPNLDHAFLWENGVMTDLNNLIAPGSGFTLTDATAISDTGYIVGNGTDAFGHDHAFLLSPAAVPEASTTVSFGLLLALGVGAMAIKRRKVPA